MEQALPSQEQAQKPMEQALPSQEQAQKPSSGDGSVSVYTNFAQSSSRSDQEEKEKDTMATYQIKKTATAPERTASNYRALIAAQPTFRSTTISPEAIRAFSSLAEKPSMTFFPSLTRPVLQQASPVLTPAVPRGYLRLPPVPQISPSIPPVPQISPSIPPDVILPEVVEEPWYKKAPGMAAIGIGILALVAGGYAIYKSQGA